MCMSFQALNGLGSKLDSKQAHKHNHTATMSDTKYNTHNLPSATKPQRKRLYTVLRIIDNRLQALAPSDPEDRESEPEWTDLGAETCLWEDRETAFQIGRTNGGLLVSADGIPGGHRLVAFHNKVRELRAIDATPASEEETPAAPRTQSPKEAARAAREAARQRDLTPAQAEEQPY